MIPRSTKTKFRVESCESLKTEKQLEFEDDIRLLIVGKAAIVGPM